MIVLVFLQLKAKTLSSQLIVTCVPVPYNSTIVPRPQMQVIHVTLCTESELYYGGDFHTGCERATAYIGGGKKDKITDK